MVFEHRAYSNRKRCVLECVKGHIQQRNGRVDKDPKRLFVTHRKPYHATSIDTLRRWIKETFVEINLTENFTQFVAPVASVLQQPKHLI